MKTRITVVLIVLLITNIVFGQATTYKDSLFSKSLNKTMYMSIVVPSTYSEKKPIPILYLLHGHGSNHDYFIKYTNIEQFVEDAYILCITPQADNSFYINAHSAPEDRYEAYLIEDLPEFIQNKYNVDTESQSIAGFSMGGYGALTLAMRYPERFDFAASIAGAIMIPQDIEILEKLPKYEFAVPSTDRVFGELPNKYRDKHDPFLLYKNQPPEYLPYIFLFTGLQDYFTDIPEAQRELADSLNTYGALHEYHELQGGHSRFTVNPSIKILLTRIKYLRENGYRYLSPVLYKELLESGITSTIEQYYDLKDNYKDEYIINEKSLNYFGNQLLRENMVKEAIEIFKLNVKEYPNASNTYDSLGEAYLLKGNKKLAIKNYKRSLELNPDNKNAIEMLKKLGKDIKVK